MNSESASSINLARREMIAILCAWVFSRAVVVLAMVLAAPHAGIERFAHWDGGWYGAIVAHGYEFVADDKQHSVAFFPLYPLLARAVMLLGIGWPGAGLVVNNACFLGALYLSFAYAARRFGRAAGYWCIVVLCALPQALFTVTTYSEGLFLFASALALWSFDRDDRLTGALSLASSTAAKSVGIALTFALIVSSIVRRRWDRLVAALCGLAGVGAFAVYCALRFRDPFAFVHAQHGWRANLGMDWAAWLAIVQFPSLHNLPLVVVVAGAIVALTRYRRALGLTGCLYVAFALGMVAFAGTPFSADRALYAVLPIPVALGALAREKPWIGYVGVVAALAGLVAQSAAFARWQWVG